MVDLWHQCRGPDGGLAQLPDTGGINDQSAWLMDAFRAIGKIIADRSGAP